MGMHHVLVIVEEAIIQLIVYKKILHMEFMIRNSVQHAHHLVMNDLVGLQTSVLVVNKDII